jgi:hypothetical protein
MNRLGLDTAPPEENKDDDSSANVDPYRVLGFSYIAMRETWLAIMKFFAITSVFLLAGGVLYAYFGAHESLYNLKNTAWITISNLKQTEQVCIQNYVELTDITRVFTCPSGSSIVEL